MSNKIQDNGHVSLLKCFIKTCVLGLFCFVLFKAVVKTALAQEQPETNPIAGPAEIRRRPSLKAVEAVR